MIYVAFRKTEWFFKEYVLCDNSNTIVKKTIVPTIFKNLTLTGPNEHIGILCSVIMLIKVLKELKSANPAWL